MACVDATLGLSRKVSRYSARASVDGPRPAAPIGKIVMQCGKYTVAGELLLAVRQCFLGADRGPTAFGPGLSAPRQTVVAVLRHGEVLQRLVKLLKPVLRCPDCYRAGAKSGRNSNARWNCSLASRADPAPAGPGLDRQGLSVCGPKSQGSAAAVNRTIKLTSAR